MNKKKLKNIAYVSPISEINEFVKIACHHEDLPRNYHKHEAYFLNANMEIVAQFESSEPFYVEQLSENVGNLFLLHDIFNEVYKIIQVENCKHEVIYSCQDIEQGVEDGCFAVKNNNLWGFINEDGTEIIKPQYKDYCAFASNLAAVKKDGKWGFIDKSNETIIPFEYDIPEFSSFCGDLAPVGKNGKFGYIDKNGKVIIPLKYEETYITYPNAKIFPVKNNGKWGFVDIGENVVIPFEYDNIECNDDGYPYYSVIKCGDYAKENPTFDTYGLVDPVGEKLIIPCVYNLLCPNPNSICAGIITDNKEEKYGLIDYRNNKLTDFTYDRMDTYSSEGLYEARLGKIWGYIDEKGNIAVDFKYTQLDSFCGGFALTRNKDWKPVLINSKGEEILTSDSRRDIYNLGAGYALVQNPKTSEYEIVKVKE